MEIESVREKFKALRLQACAQHLESVIEMAQQKNRSSLEAMGQILDLELDARKQRKTARRFKESKLAEKLTIDQFDFHFHKSRQDQKAVILNLIDLGFIRQCQDIILIGNPGAGKTFLAKCMAYTATQAGIKVLFTTAMDMVNHLIAADADHSLMKKLQHYRKPDLLVCDELGYLPLGAQGSSLFFQVISGRHDRKSTIITTNLAFADWGTIFDTVTTATAIADRLVYNSKVIILEGSSYRKRMKKP